MNRLSAITLSTWLAFAGLPAAAFASGDHAGSHSAEGHGGASTSTVSTEAASMTDGEIKKVDKELGKVTIKHSELKNLEMPAMTMVFQVKDKSMLDQVKPGDQVTFVAEKVNGKFTVTQLEVKK